MDLKSRAELAERIRQLALLLAEAAGELEYYGGFDEAMRKSASDLDAATLLAWGCFESLNIIYKIQPVVVLSIYDNINSTR